MPCWHTHETNEPGAVNPNLRLDRVVELEAWSASSVVVCLEEEEEEEGCCAIPMQGRLGKKVLRRRAHRHNMVWSKKRTKGRDDDRAEGRMAPRRKSKHRGLDCDILHEIDVVVRHKFQVDAR